MKVVVSALLAAGLLSTPSFADGKKGHCEIKKDGKTTDVEPPEDVKDVKKWCKDQGGKWEKGEKHDHK